MTSKLFNKGFSNPEIVACVTSQELFKWECPFCVCALFVLLIFCLSHPLSNVDKDYQVEFN